MPETPAEKLKKMKDELQKSQAEIDNATKQRDTLRGEITPLEKIVNDVKLTASAYSQALSNFEKEKMDLEEYYQNKARMFEAPIKDKKDAIDQKIKEFDNQTQEAQKEVDGLKEKSKEANAEYEKAQKDFEAKQYEYDSLKVFQKKIGDELKELKNLKESIQKYQEKNEISKMCFLISELNNLLKNTTIKKREDLESELCEKWSELDLAKTALRDADKKRKDAQDESEKAEKNLALRNKNRREEILKMLS